MRRRRRLCKHIRFYGERAVQFSLPLGAGLWGWLRKQPPGQPLAAAAYFSSWPGAIRPIRRLVGHGCSDAATQLRAARSKAGENCKAGGGASKDGSTRYKESKAAYRATTTGHDWNDPAYKGTLNKFNKLRSANLRVQWQWCKYLENIGARCRDPKLHSKEFLKKFLALEAEGKLPEVQLATQDLVESMVKYMRLGGRPVWRHFCLDKGFGILDPRANSAEFVKTFLAECATPALDNNAAVRRNDQRRGVKDVRLTFEKPLTDVAMEPDMGGTHHMFHGQHQDGRGWVLTPCKKYSFLLKEKILLSLGDLSQSAVELPANATVFESARRYFRMRSYFDIVFSEGKLLYMKDEVYVNHYPRGSVRMNEVMDQVRDAMEGSEVLRKNLHQIFIHTTSTGDAVAMCTYKDRWPQGWHLAAEELRAAGLPMSAMRFPSVGTPPSYWSSRQSRLLVDRDTVVERFKAGGRMLEYEQAIGLFSQVNFGACQQMIRWAETHVVGDGGDLLELYCGNGCFTLALAHNFRRCLASEISHDSVALAKANAARNGITNVRILRSDSGRIAKALQAASRRSGQAASIKAYKEEVSLEDYDFRVILVNPPRTGLTGPTRRLLVDFDKVAYISCHPVSLARDLDELAATHEIETLAFFDQFPYTKHIECGVVLRRTRK